MRKIIAAAEQKHLSVRVGDGKCLVNLPCSEWILFRMIAGYSQLHLTASKGAEELLTRTYDLQPTKAGYYLTDEDTASGFIPMLSDSIAALGASQCKNGLEELASRLKSMANTEQRTESVKRIGQDKLRQLLLACIGECEISGVRNKDLLVASHIKPWEACADANDRLDPENVLLLAANWDALFDKKYISFDPETGRMIKAERISEETLRQFGVPECWRETIGIHVKTDRRKEYLKWHNRKMAEADKAVLAVSELSETV